ncbi:hypothetical protein COOONC_17326 [Cooperia oncophora]
MLAESDSAYAGVEFQVVITSPSESTSKADIDEKGHETASTSGIMKRRQDPNEKRHLLHPDDEVFEEGLVFQLEPLPPINPDRKSRRRDEDDAFPEEEPKKRRRRGRRRSGMFRLHQLACFVPSVS